MENVTRVKINLKSGELEISGSEQFVEKQIEKLDEIVALMNFKETQTADEEAEEKIEEALASADDATKNKSLDIPTSIGEWLHSFKDDLADMDKVLAVGYYMQKSSPENDFKTSQVTKALKEHGYNLSNPTMSLNYLSEKKLVFQNRKVGVLKFMRVSADGEKYLKTLKR
jgi:NACalpha-BTF3-like transcription factor